MWYEDTYVTTFGQMVYDVSRGHETECKITVTFSQRQPLFTVHHCPFFFRLVATLLTTSRQEDLLQRP
jgi:hypothetical protein